MLELPSPSDAARLRVFFTEAGYTQENILDKIGISELPSTRLRNLPRLADKTQEPNCLNTLLRWFWVGAPKESAEASKYMPPWFLSLALACKILRSEASSLAPTVMLSPFEGLLIASDHTAKLDIADPDLVLWPNPSSRLLSRFTVRRPVTATLDLGTGTGIQALWAAAHSQKVIATDLNKRALAFAAFNARLNGIEGIEFLFGDGLEPVGDQKFDLIVSNPPFFISPSKHYLFCDNSMDLDLLCRRLIRDAASHLNEGGYCQMLCEWAQVEGQTWQERVTEWFANTGCDAWVIKGQTRDASEYAQDHIRETTSSSTHDADLYRTYMDYYKERKVQAIHDGIIAMRRRTGQNWLLIDEVAHAPQEPFGETVRTIFDARDFLQSSASDDQLLSVRPKLSPHVRLEQISQQEDGGWKNKSVTLRLVKGFPYSWRVQPLVVEFLGGCDGRKTLQELTSEFAAQVTAPPEQVRKECSDLIRVLIAHGFVHW